MARTQQGTTLGTGLRAWLRVFRQGPRLSVVATLALAPWLLVAMATGGLSTAVLLLLTLAVVAGVGVLAVIFGMGEVGDLRVLLAVPIGFIVVASILALGARLAIPLRLTGWLLTAAGLAALPIARRSLHGVFRRRVSLGFLYVLLSALTCAVYFAPGAWRDGVTTKDGGFQWMYVDTQYHMAVAAAVKTEHGPPAMPGMAAAPLTYHFAPYAVMGALSAMTGLPIPDASARVVRAIGQIALLLAALALGRVLGGRIGDPTVAGLAAAVGVFFYGSLSALFVPHVNSTALTNLPALLFSVPDVGVVHDGGWFSHLILGHSELWGGIGLLATLALIVGRLTSIDRPRLTVDLLILLPALVACLNVVAGAGLVGVAAGVYLLLAFRHRRAIILAVGTLLAAVVVVWVMGYIGSPSASGVALDLGYSLKALALWRWLFIGLGIRIVAAAWWRQWRTEPVAWILFLLVAGYLSMGYLLRDSFDNHNTYALKFLQGVLSVFAFAWLGAMWARGHAAWRETVVPELLHWGWRIGVLLLAADALAGLMMAIHGAPAAHSLAVWSLKFGTIGAAAVTGGCLLALALRRRGTFGSRPISAVTLTLLAVGFLAWVPSWLGFGLNRLHVDVTLSPSEVTALRWIRRESRPDALIATNHHAVARFRNRKDRSYGYRVLSDRPILLEGWDYGEKLDPRFAAIRRDNALLFRTGDADSARAVVQRYGIQFLITAPGTDLHIPQPVPWLHLAARFGSVKVYRTAQVAAGAPPEAAMKLTTRSVLRLRPGSDP